MSVRFPHYTPFLLETLFIFFKDLFIFTTFLKLIEHELNDKAFALALFLHDYGSR